jgi:diphthine-ammonia ligase
MKVVALISGGKDSCFNMMQCVAAGHEIVALANLHPVEKEGTEINIYILNTIFIYLIYLKNIIQIEL